MKRFVASLLGSLLIAAAVSAQTPASSLKTTGAPVNVSQAAPPAGSGRACVTTNSTHCTWQLLSGIGLLTVPITTANGGTGADLSGLSAGQMIAFDGSVFAGVNLATISTAPGDTASTVSYWSATDSGANTSNVSVGIELPNSVGVAGDLVVRTGGSGASGSGTARAYFRGSGDLFIYTNQLQIEPVSNAAFQFTQNIAPYSSIQLSNSLGVTAFDLIGVDGGSSNISGGVGMIDGSGVSGTPQLITVVAGIQASQMATVDSGFFVSNWPRMVFTQTSYENVPFAFNLVAAGTDGAIAAHSLGGISALFQTSATDGSNANPTVVFAGNTGQTAPLTEWRGTDGTTVVASVGIGGNVDAASFSVASTPGFDGSGTSCTITAITKGIVTGASCTP